MSSPCVPIDGALRPLLDRSGRVALLEGGLGCLAKLGTSNDVPRSIIWIAALGVLAGVYDLNAIAVVLVHLQAIWRLSAMQVSLLGAPLAGMVLGAPIAGLLADRHGRRWLLIADFGSFLVAAVFSALAPDYWSLLGWRFIIGLGIGADFALVFPYLAEEIPPARRGHGACPLDRRSWSAARILFGSVLVGRGPDGFRLVLAFGALLAVATLISRRSLPETRAWHSQHLRRSAPSRAVCARAARRRPSPPPAFYGFCTGPAVRD